MTCPFCNAEYTAEAPCRCREEARAADPQPGPLVAPANLRVERKAAMEPTGLSNPFWSN